MDGIQAILNTGYSMKEKKDIIGACLRYGPCEYLAQSRPCPWQRWSHETVDRLR